MYVCSMLVRLKSICILELQTDNGNMYRTDRCWCAMTFVVVDQLGDLRCDRFWDRDASLEEVKGKSRGLDVIAGGGVATLPSPFLTAALGNWSCYSVLTGRESDHSRRNLARRSSRLQMYTL